MNVKNKICPFCYKKISIKKHLIKCNPDIDEDNAYLMMIELTYNCKINDVIIDYKSGFSLPDIKKKYSLSYKTTINILKIKEEPIRSIKESSNKNREKKYVETCNAKYGVNNISKLSEIKDKKRKTFLKNYGVDNIFKTNEFKSNLDKIMLLKYKKKRITNPEKISESRKQFSEEKWNEINKKTENTYLTKCSETHYSKTPEKRKEKSENMIKWWNSLSSDQKIEISECQKIGWNNRTDEQKILFSKQRKDYWKNLTDLELETFIRKNLETISNTELLVKKVLDANSINYIQQIFINRKSYDFLIVDTKILIEVQGDYWHANPKIYNESDLIKYPRKKLISVKDIWKNDEIKNKNAKKYDYTIIYLWEYDINVAKRNDNLEEFILNTLYENCKN